MTKFGQVTAPRKSRQDSAQRRGEIAKAALQVLGESGLRGLTHRAVDAAAALAPGSVNYHAPTRQRLLDLAIDELFARDMAIAERFFLRVQNWTPAAIAEAAAGFVDAMGGPGHRHLVVARHHLLGEAQYNSALAEKFRQQRAAFVNFVRDRFEAEGHPASTALAEMYVIAIDGLTHRQVFFAASALAPHEVIAALRTITVPP